MAWCRAVPCRAVPCRAVPSQSYSTEELAELAAAFGDYSTPLKAAARPMRATIARLDTTSDRWPR